MNISSEMLIGFIGIMLSIFIEGLIVSNKFGHLDQKVTDIAAKQDKHNNMLERMVIVEQSTKSAHHRVDMIDEKLEKFEENCHENIRKLLNPDKRA